MPIKTMNNTIIALQTVNIFIKHNQNIINESLKDINQEGFIFSSAYQNVLKKVIKAENALQVYSKTKNMLIERMLNA
jgi:hypothetical protein